MNKLSGLLRILIHGVNKLFGPPLSKSTFLLFTLKILFHGVNKHSGPLRILIHGVNKLFGRPLSKSTFWLSSVLVLSKSSFTARISFPAPPESLFTVLIHGESKLSGPLRIPIHGVNKLFGQPLSKSTFFLSSVRVLSKSLFTA